MEAIQAKPTQIPRLSYGRGPLQLLRTWGLIKNDTRIPGKVSQIPYYKMEKDMGEFKRSSFWKKIA